MKQGEKDATSPVAYLWARCEGWVRIGVFHAVIIDHLRGICRNEAGETLLSEVDGLWRSNLPKFEGLGFDQVAVTHLPLDPHQMSKPDWLSNWNERQEKMRRLRSARSADEKRGSFG